MGSVAPSLQRLVDQVLCAHARGIALDIRGGSTKHFYGGVPRGEPLEVGPHAGIVSYEPTELVITARAGTPLADLEAALAERGQCLRFEPPRFAPGGTVGGMVAAGLAGPARVSAGGVRDGVLGVTVLNGKGHVLAFGGQVMKNVAGYDVSRLLVGSLGLLGVLCEVSLKVLPTLPAQATVVFDVDEDEALQRMNDWRGQPLPINACAWHAGRLFLRLAGARAAVDAASVRLGGLRLADDHAAAWWEDCRDHRHSFFLAATKGLSAGLSLWRVAVAPRAKPLALPGEQWIDWLGGQRWLLTAASTSEVRAAAVRGGGHATLFRSADRSAGTFAPLTAPLERIHRALKHAFDPAGVFNPGRLYPDL